MLSGSVDMAFQEPRGYLNLTASTLCQENTNCIYSMGGYWSTWEVWYSELHPVSLRNMSLPIYIKILNSHLEFINS